MTIAITGGIGSGKSEVLKILRSQNYECYSADEIYKEERKNNEKLNNEIFSVFNTLDNAVIAKIVFNDKIEKVKLEKITHSYIVGKIKELTADKNLTFVEVPTLFESGLEKEFDKIILITADLNTRVQRVINRDNKTYDDIIKIVNSQMPDEEKMKKSHYIINNSSDSNSLKMEVENVTKNL